MRQLALTSLAACALLACGTTQAQVSCSVTATSVSGTYARATALNLTGNISVTCSRNSGIKNRTIYIGVNNGVNGVRNLKRQSGSDLLAYSIYRNAGNTGSWTEGAGQTSGTTAAGGLLAAWDFNASNSPPTQNFAYYFQAAAGYNMPPGIYDDSPVTVTVHLDSGSGAVLTAVTFIPQVTILASCSLSSPPGTLTLNYTSFSTTAVNNSTNFDATCTLTTPYTLALDATSGTISGINYTLALSTASGTGTGLAQTYSVTGTAAAGQAGTCSGAACSASQSRTLTITY